MISYTQIVYNESLILSLEAVRGIVQNIPAQEMPPDEQESEEDSLKTKMTLVILVLTMWLILNKMSAVLLQGHLEPGQQISSHILSRSLKIFTQ